MPAHIVQHDDLTEATIERFLEIVLEDDELFLLELAAVVDSDPPVMTTGTEERRERPWPDIGSAEPGVPEASVHPPPIEPWARERSPPDAPVGCWRPPPRPPSFTHRRWDTTASGSR